MYFLDSIHCHYLSCCPCVFIDFIFISSNSAHFHHFPDKSIVRISQLNNMFDSSFSHSSEQPLSRAATDRTALQLMHDVNLILHLNPDCMDMKLVSDPSAIPQEYKVEDSLAFVPKKLWSGGVWYTAFFTPVEDGCDISVQAPGGFTSINKWRLVKKADGTRAVSITSDAKCSKTFAFFVKRFLDSNHAQMQRAFNERIESVARPGIPRRRSSMPGSFRSTRQMVAA
jgi:hypothetical protein